MGASSSRIWPGWKYGACSLRQPQLHLGRSLSLWSFHAKQLHMLFNVLSLALLGVFVERHARGPGFFLLWFLSGSAGTVLGTLSTAPPWHLGTGGSQAVSGIAAFGLVLHLKGVVPSKWFAAILCFTIIPAFALDFIHAGHPKPGHVVGFLVGAVAGLAFCRHGRPGTLWNGRT